MSMVWMTNIAKDLAMKLGTTLAMHLVMKLAMALAATLATELATTLSNDQGVVAKVVLISYDLDDSNDPIIS